MRSILKNSEPRELTTFRASADLNDRSTYESFPHKNALRSNLIDEQRGLCAFCGGRIINDPNAMKVAHWKPRLHEVVSASGETTYPYLAKQLDYSNLLGVCKGNEGKPLAKQHCDTHQRNFLISKNPAILSDRIEEIISFLTDGSITSSNVQFNRELGQRIDGNQFEQGVLNLNLQFLRNNRKAVLDAFKRGLEKRGKLTSETIIKLISEWRGDSAGELEPYAPVVVYWLKKRLKQELNP